MSDLVIGPLDDQDRAEVLSLVKTAFEDAEFSDGREQHLVDRLLASEGYQPALSLKAVANHRIIGFVLLSEIEMRNSKGCWASLSLAPVAVLPEFQRKGVGKALILKAHEIAEALGYASVIVVGHKDYYPKFGYRKLAAFDMTLPFDVPEDYRFIKVLGYFDERSKGSVVKYPQEFFE